MDAPLPVQLPPHAEKGPTKGPLAVTVIVVFALISFTVHLASLRGYIFCAVYSWIVPWIIASLRIGVGLSLVGAVVGELLGASAGLGWYVEKSAGRLDTTGVFVGLVMLTFLATIGNVLVARLEARFSGWRPS